MSNSILDTFEAENQDKYTQELIFVPGEFRLSRIGTVPYLAAVMPLRDLVDEIHLVEDIPEEARFDWSLEELFQRDISWDRVKDELVDGYLKDQNKLTFFNSLTIALLPQDGYKIEESYGEAESKSPGRGDGWNRIDVGNICIEHLTAGGIGVVRWNKERIFPVAIDGQHRLAALKEYYNEKRETTAPNAPEFDTKIPLIFLILDQRLGFKGRPEDSLIRTLREIFIDLNKNARQVPKSRLILLEDQNIQSLCVRTLLADKAKEFSSDVLPLSIVTWRENEPKFDSGYSFTSVLNLNDIVSYCFDRASLRVEDLLEERRIKQYVDKITAKLQLEPGDQESIQEHVELCISRVEPFSFNEEHLNAFREAFRQQWAPHIVRVFKEFEPYKNYCLTAEKIGALDSMLADYLLLPIERRKKFIEMKKTDDETFNPDSEIKVPLKVLEDLKSNEWAFQVVFQKALFINLFELEPQAPSVFNLNGRDQFLSWWISHLNELHTHGVFHLHWKAEKGKADLWLGIANNPGSGTIQYTQAAANRISSFITISIYFRHYDSSLNENEFANSLMNGSDSIPPLVINAFDKVKSGLESLVGAMSSSDETDDEKILNREVKSQLVKRLKALKG